MRIYFEFWLSLGTSHRSNGVIRGQSSISSLPYESCHMTNRTHSAVIVHHIQSVWCASPRCGLSWQRSFWPMSFYFFCNLVQFTILAYQMFRSHCHCLAMRVLQTPAQPLSDGPTMELIDAQMMNNTLDPGRSQPIRPSVHHKRIHLKCVIR